MKITCLAMCRRVLLLAAWTTALGVISSLPASAAETTTAYVAALDFANLPYGEYEMLDVRALMTDHLKNAGGDQGLVIYQSGHNGGSTPVGMALLTLLYGADQQQAEGLLRAAAEARNVANPRLMQATVYRPETLSLPPAGELVYDREGRLLEFEGELLYFPTGFDLREIETEVERWHLERFAKKVDFSIGPIGNGWSMHLKEVQPGPRPAGTPLSEMPPEFRRQHAIGNMAHNWQRYDQSEPWYSEPIPVQPLSGGTWVKGYQVNMMRFDAATDETVARLLADVDEFVRRVRSRYPTAAVALEFNDRREITPGKQAQPMLELYVAVDDQAWLEQIGEELSARAAIDAGYPRIMGVSARWRVPFLASAAQAVPGVLVDSSLIVKHGFVFPAGLSAEEIEAEIANWEDQWLELWKISDNPPPSYLELE